MAARTRARASPLTCPPFRTRDTVLAPTPAWLATSEMVAVLRVRGTRGILTHDVAVLDAPDTCPPAYAGCFPTGSATPPVVTAGTTAPSASRCRRTKLRNLRQLSH